MYIHFNENRIQFTLWVTVRLRVALNPITLGVDAMYACAGGKEKFPDVTTTALYLCMVDCE